MEGDEKDKIPSQIREVIFSWDYKEMFRYDKNTSWYVTSLIILGVAIVWCVIDKNIPFALFLILFYLVVLLYNNLEPQDVKFIITTDGIKIGSRFYYFRDFDHFFVVYEEFGIKNLYLQFKNPLKGRLIVPLDGQDAVNIRRYLLKFLKEDLQREAEPLSERLRRWLKL